MKHAFGLVTDGTRKRKAPVLVYAIRYRDWLATWPAPPDPVGVHGRAVLERFEP